jgi:hypothetical protein
MERPMGRGVEKGVVRTEKKKRKEEREGGEEEGGEADKGGEGDDGDGSSIGSTALSFSSL